MCKIIKKHLQTKKNMIILIYKKNRKKEEIK